MKNYQKPEIDTMNISLDDAILVSRNPETLFFEDGESDEIW